MKRSAVLTNARDTPRNPNGRHSTTTEIPRGSSITQDDVVYLIVTDRFADGDPANNGSVDPSDPYKRHGGNLLGIVQHMPYLRALGVTALWISPVYLNPPDAYHGYHPLSFEQIDPHLYSPELGPEGKVRIDLL